MILPNELFLIIISLISSQSIAAMYSYPFGYYGGTLIPCACARAAVTKYQKRISDSMLDCTGICSCMSTNALYAEVHDSSSGVMITSDPVSAKAVQFHMEILL